MKKKVDNKGFTLVELLAVLVILTAIMGVAIPSISSSLERSKNKQNKAREKVLASAAELYVADNKNSIYEGLTDGDRCYITLSSLSEYIPDDASKDADDQEMTGFILFTKPNNYEYISNISGISQCFVRVGETEGDAKYSEKIEGPHDNAAYSDISNYVNNKQIYESYDFDSSTGLFKLTGGDCRVYDVVSLWSCVEKNSKTFICVEGTDDACTKLYNISKVILSNNTVTYFRITSSGSTSLGYSVGEVISKPFSLTGSSAPSIVLSNGFHVEDGKFQLLLGSDSVSGAEALDKINTFSIDEKYKYSCLSSTTSCNIMYEITGYNSRSNTIYVKEYLID